MEDKKYIAKQNLKSKELFHRFNEEQKDFLKSISIPDAIQEWSKRIQAKKEEVFLQRLKELNIEFDLEEEKKRRFPRFRIETEMYKETYWYNDGSVEGLRIITFVTSQPSLPNINDAVSTIKLNVDISYY